MKLHGYWRSSCSYRVRIALAVKGLPYETVPVHLLEDRQRDEAFLAVNPSGQVPVLEIEAEGRPVGLGQSMAILEYLEETYPQPPLLPREPVARARARQLAEVVNSGIQPLQNLFVMKQLKREGLDPVAWCTFHVRRGLLAYDALAASTAGRFSVGDAPTFADCALIPQLFNARRFAIDVEAEMPRLARIEAECVALEAFRAAHPDRQPDAVS